MNCLGRKIGRLDHSGWFHDEGVELGRVLYDLPTVFYDSINTKSVDKLHSALREKKWAV